MAFSSLSSLHRDLTAFIEQNFFWCFLFAILWNVAFIAWSLWRRARRGLKLPKPEDADVVFVEKFASGCSHKTFLTRIGGAGRTLTVIVTGSDLAITTFFPAYAGILDLEHLIPRSKILKVEERGARVEVEFLNGEGLPAKFSMRLQKTGEFLRAMRGTAFVSP